MIELRASMPSRRIRRWSRRPWPGAAAFSVDGLVPPGISSRACLQQVVGLRFSSLVKECPLDNPLCPRRRGRRPRRKASRAGTRLFFSHVPPRRKSKFRAREVHQVRRQHGARLWNQSETGLELPAESEAKLRPGVADRERDRSRRGAWHLFQTSGAEEDEGRPVSFLRAGLPRGRTLARPGIRPLRLIAAAPTDARGCAFRSGHAGSRSSRSARSFMRRVQAEKPYW